MKIPCGGGLVTADLAGRVECGQPGHDLRVVLKLDAIAKASPRPESLLQFWGDARDAAHAGGDGLPAIGDRQHRKRRPMARPQAEHSPHSVSLDVRDHGDD